MEARGTDMKARRKEDMKVKEGGLKVGKKTATGGELGGIELEALGRYRDEATGWGKCDGN